MKMAYRPNVQLVHFEFMSNKRSIFMWFYMFAGPLGVGQSQWENK